MIPETISCSKPPRPLLHISRDTGEGRATSSTDPNKSRGVISHQRVGRLSARQQRPIEGSGLPVIAAQVQACGQSWRCHSITRGKQVYRRQRARDSIGSEMAPRVDERAEPGTERRPYRPRKIIG